MQKFELIFFENNRDNFDRIRSEKKTTETRAGTSADTEQKHNYSATAEGDLITFTCGSDHFQKVVKSVRKYNDLDSFLETEDLRGIFGRDVTKNEAREIYLSFPNNYPERISKYGMIAVDLVNE